MISVLAWPLQGDRLYMILAGGLFISLPEILGKYLPDVPYIGMIPIALQALMVCYIAIYSHSIIREAAAGKTEVDLWPEAADGHALIQGLLESVVPLIVSFLPLIAAFVFFRFRLEPQPPALLGALAVAGILYIPVAYLMEMFWGQAAVFNIVGAVRTIATIGRDYFATVGLLVVLAAAGTGLLALSGTLPSAPATVLRSLVAIYVLMAAMRMIGLLYYHHRQALGWEREVKPLP